MHALETLLARGGHASLRVVSAALAPARPGGTRPAAGPSRLARGSIALAQLILGAGAGPSPVLGLGLVTGLSARLAPGLLLGARLVLGLRLGTRLVLGLGLGAGLILGLDLIPCAVLGLGLIAGLILGLILGLIAGLILGPVTGLILDSVLILELILELILGPILIFDLVLGLILGAGPILLGCLGREGEGCAKDKGHSNRGIHGCLLAGMRNRPHLPSEAVPAVPVEGNPWDIKVFEFMGL